MKYWRLKLKGERSVDEIQSIVGRSGGTLVRVHSEGGEMQVYFAAEKLATDDAAAKAAKEMGKPEEVTTEVVTMLG